MLALVSTYNSSLYKFNYIEDKFTCLFCSAETHLIGLWLQIARGTSTKAPCIGSQAVFSASNPISKLKSDYPNV